MSKPQFSSQQIEHIAQLANIPITQADESMLASAFADTLEVVAKMGELDTSKTPPTHQVTGLENAWREDVVEEKRMFTQSQAVANAAKTHNGYFVVSQVIEQNE